MQLKPRSHGIIATLFAICFHVAASAEGVSVPNQTAIEQRRASIHTLIESSSGAVQVERSSNPAAQSRRSAARVFLHAADGALAEGNGPGASRLLDEAAKAMFDAVRLAEPEQVGAVKARHDFDTRMDSTRALIAAQRRINVERGVSTANEPLRETEALLVHASQTAEKGDIKRARALLDEAYLQVRTAVRGMRGGETLLRSLSFANKEEEFQYERDRNDTHASLTSLLLAENTEKRNSVALGELISRSSAEATRLRSVADAAAQKRDFAAGVRALEESTREWVRVMRIVGIQVPG